MPNESQLAVALATLERQRYMRIRAAEYIAHACELPLESPNLQEAITLHKKIRNWVQLTILEPKTRSQDKGRFVNIAEVNFYLLGLMDILID